MTNDPILLNADRITLREFTIQDIDAALRIVGDDKVTTSLSFETRDRGETAAMIKGAIARAAASPRLEYYFAITAPDLIGFVRLGLSGVRAAKLGYALEPGSWGKGYAAEAVRTMIGFAFSQLALHRVSAAVGPENRSSLSLLDRLGFTYEGRIRDHVHTNGSWRDSLLYSVLEPEWGP